MYFQGLLTDSAIIASLPSVQQGIKILNAYHHKRGQHSIGGEFIETPSYKRWSQLTLPILKQFAVSHHYNSMYLLCSDHGSMIVSTIDTQKLGASIVGKTQKQQRLLKLWRAVKEKKKAIFSDYYRVNNGEIFFYLGAPIFDAENKLLAVLVIQASIDAINRIMEEHIGLGDSGQTYLVGPDTFMRSNSRFIKQAVLAQKVGSSELHTMMEIVSTIFSMMVGVFSIIRYYTKKELALLFVGTAFVGTAFLDGYHMVVTSKWFSEVMPPPQELGAALFFS